MQTLRLGVNIDHVATLRQARGVTYPDVLAAARCVEAAGAHGVTIHLREDRRHIQDADVFGLREMLTARMNLEMANNPEIVDIAIRVRPEEVCLVPERRAELTTEGGLDAAGRRAELEPTVQRLAAGGISVSLFIDPDDVQIEAAAALRVPYVELHTGAYCQAVGAAAGAELERLVRGARRAHELGIQVNAGHGLNLENVAGIFRMPYLDTLNIGHSIVARAVFVGLEQAVREMMDTMCRYTAGEQA